MSLLGKLNWSAIPFDQPIIMGATGGMVLFIGLVLAWVTLKGYVPYLWREWITSVDHKRIGIMYIILALIMLLRGFSAQFSGDGFADMYFNVVAVAPGKFSEWVATVRSTGLELDARSYTYLAKPSTAVTTPFTYGSVTPGLFDSIRVSEMESDDAICRSYPTSMRAEK